MMPKRKRDQDQDEGGETLVMPAVPIPDAPDIPEEPPAATDESQPPPQPELGADQVIERAPLVALVEVNGPGDGHVTPISGGTCMIGRHSPDLTLRLPYDHWVSRAHARLTYQSGVWTLEDLHSSNGTWLDGGRIRVTQPVTITPGQVFRVGHTDLMLSDDPALAMLHSEPI